MFPAFADSNAGSGGGAALNPWSTLTITADMDIASNHTFVPGLKS